MTTAIRYGILATCILAFLLVVAIHVGTFSNYRLFPAGRESALGVGAIVLWLVTGASLWRVAQLRRAESWQFSLIGAPGWLRFGLFAILAYGVLNFFLVPFKRHGLTVDAERSLLDLRLWSGHALFLYLAPAVAMYSAIRMERRDTVGEASGA